MRRCRLDASSSGKGPVPGSREKGNETSGAKRRQGISRLSDY
jgi:hypothetical protein